MPAKEIKELRKSGKFKEALSLAFEELQTEPTNIWAKRNISWVYYDLIKQYVQSDNFEGFIENLQKLKELNLPVEEVMIFDNLTWQIFSMIFKLQKEEVVDYAKINQTFDCIKEFHFTKPSEGYSLLYKSFHKGYNSWSRYLEFADWWGFENFNPTDFREEKFNERKIMAMVEQAFIAYSKKLLEGEPLDQFGNQRKIDLDKIKGFIPKLDLVIKKKSNYQYPIFFKAKLLLAINDKENALNSVLPFAKQKKNDFWVWELLADIFEEDSNKKLVCLCKALSLNAKDDFLIKTRKKLAFELIKKKMFNEAKTEIKAIIKTRERNGWKISNDIMQWTNESWYADASENSSNSKLYERNVLEAEELLFSDIEELSVVVDFVNKDKKMLNFIESKSRIGYFKYNLKVSPKIGDILKVRLKPIGNEGFYKVLTIMAIDSTNTTKLDIIKEVSGKLRIPEEKPFGFLEDVFFPPNLIKENGLVNEENVDCKAILSFEKKKNTWGWKAFKVIKNQ